MMEKNEIVAGLPAEFYQVPPEQIEAVLFVLQRQCLKNDAEYEKSFPLNRAKVLADLQYHFSKALDVGVPMTTLQAFVQTISLFDAKDALPVLRKLQLKVLRRKNTDVGALVQFEIANLLPVTNFKDVQEILDNLKDLDNYPFIERRVGEIINYINENRGEMFKKLDFHNRQSIISGIHGFLYPQYPVSLKQMVGAFIETVQV